MKSALAASTGLALVVACNSLVSLDPVDAGTSVPDSGVTDAPSDSAAPPPPPKKLGTRINPAASCKALLETDATVPSDTYWLKVGEQAFETYCDMVTRAGGWTRVTPAVPAVDVRTLLLGADGKGKQLLKCTDPSANYIESPPFDATVFDWSSLQPVLVDGKWIRNGTGITCAKDALDSSGCASSVTWFGVGCNGGAGTATKVAPGRVSTDGGGVTCATYPRVLLEGSLELCPADHTAFAIFVRAE